MSLTIEGVDQLIIKAKKSGVPFKENYNPKNYGLWLKRAARSTDIVILNKSKFNFRLTDESRSSGVWTEGMLPVPEIKAKRSIIYGCQSRGIMTGCTECSVSYSSTCGKASFTIYSSNPYIGARHAGAVKSSNVTISSHFDQQSNNLVCFTII